MPSPTAIEMQAKMEEGTFQVKLWAQKMDKLISEEMELIEQKHWPDWRPRRPLHLAPQPKGDTVTIRRQPRFMLRSSASKQS
jgi:hypothetical protein